MNDNIQHEVDIEIEREKEASDLFLDRHINEKCEFACLGCCYRGKPLVTRFHRICPKCSLTHHKI